MDINLRHCVLLLPLLLLTSKCVSQVFPALRAYENCTFDDGLQIVELTSLAPGVTSRSVKTRTDTMLLKMLAGRRVMLAYPDTDFFANVKVEILPQEEWKAEKQIVLDGLDYLLASAPENRRNYALPSQMSGLGVQGFDRSKLEGGVLGMYLLLDEPNHIVTTIYFLNQDPGRRKFQSFAEYEKLRDAFLKRYSGCIRSNLGAMQAETAR